MELLEKHFDTALESPDGIKKLRELILTLAMQGKLVKQYPKDQPAHELLKEIQAERERLVAEGKIKRSREAAKIAKEEVPYEVPEGWAWTRLGNCSQNIHYGYTASANFQNKEIRLLRITDIQNNKVDWESVPGCDIRTYDVEKYLLKQNDILIARTGGTVGKTFLVDNIPVKAVFASYLIRVIPSKHIYINFLKSNLESPFYWKQLYEKCSGTGQPNVNGVSLSTLLIPLPPLAEQKRIVAKIDELMALCDKLEEQRKTRDRKRLAVHAAAMNGLLNAADKNEFDTSWQFVIRHFDPLYSVKENVAELKKAILTLAMQGKLVKQDPNDQPARELLKEIQAEKERLAEEGKIKRGSRGGAESAEIKPEEVPYAVPEGWVWVRFSNIAQHNTGKTLDKSRNTGQYRKYITTSNLYWGRFELNSIREMRISENELDKCTATNGDLLICEGGEAGRAAVWTETYNICFQNHIHRARFYRKIDAFYAFNFFRKINGTGEIENYRKGVGISSMSSKVLGGILFPLPPLSEQKRIVARIDELMALCDKLEEQIDRATAKQIALFDAVLARV